MTDSKFFLDTSCWLAYFFEENPDAREIIEKENIILTSTISIFEIKRKLLRDKLDNQKIETALKFIKTRSILVDLTLNIAEAAATISAEKKLPATDSLIYASAQQNKALLITGDNDFRGLSEVKIIK